MKRLHSDSDYDSAESPSPDSAQMSSRKKRRGIIEKRRRDRINNCLTDLKRLVPAAFEKQGSAKLEKAEILQMTVDHLKHLHQARDSRGTSDPFSPYGNTKAFLDYRLMGFKECVDEASRYLVSMEGLETNDPLRQRLMTHLEGYLSQRVHSINTGISASTPAAQNPLLSPIFAGSSISGSICSSSAVQTNGDYILAPNMMPFVAPSPTSLPPFTIPMPAVTFPSVAMTTIPVAISTTSPQMVLSKADYTPLNSPVKTKSSKTTTFRPWVGDNVAP